MSTCLLTGATGFLGAHVARALCDAGWTVRALARGGAIRLGDLPSRGVVPVAGDLSETSDLGSAAAGADAIVHVAGVTQALSLEKYREVNARGTERLVRAARRTSPHALFVLVSSQAAAGPARGGRPVREEDAPRPVSRYGLSKREGEVAVATGWPGPWIVLRPSVIYGPGDRAMLLLFQAAARGVLPVPSGASRIQVIHAERAARAIAAAAARPDLTGRAAFLCDPDPISIRGLSEEIARLPPRRPLLLPLPRAVVRVAGWAATALEAATRRPRPFNADKAGEILAGDWIAEGEPLARDLALPPAIPLSEGLRATWDWYRRADWLIL